MMKALSVKVKISLTVATVFIVLAATETFFAFRYFEGAYRNSVNHDLSLMSATLADGIDSRLAMAQSALGGARAALPPAALADTALARKFLGERVSLQAVFPNAILLISPSGQLIAAYPPRLLNGQRDFARQDFFATTMTRKATTFSAVAERPGKSAEFIVAMPVSGADGEVRAILAGIAELSFSKLSVENLIREKIGSGTHLYLASRSGAYLLHQGEKRQGEKIPDEQITLFDQALAGVEATGETISCNGERVLISLQRLTNIDSILMVSYPLSLAYAPLDRAKGYFLGAIALGTAVLLALAWYMSMRITGPLQIMIRHVKELPDLPYGKRLLNLKTGDEIGTLATAFDQLIVTLEERETELVKLSQKHRQRAVELAAINRELEAFSSSLSHDLKTPLTSICLSAEALQQRLPEGDDANTDFFLSTILAESERMSELIEAMLLLSRVSRAEISCEEVDLSAMARKILMSLSKGSPDRRVEWVVAPDVVVSGDARLLMSAMENLLGNAWKYTEGKEGARIEFGAQQDDERVFFVKDNGIGFDMAKADRLFEPFQRLHGEERFKGFGIGLVTVQRIIQRHGGRIWAASEPGLGATFYFTLQVESSRAD